MAKATAVTHCIDIFLIQVRKIKPGQAGKPLSKVKTENDYSKIGDIFSSFIDVEPLVGFYQLMVKHFDSEFQMNSDKTKGISIAKDTFKGYDKDGSLIWGTFLAGPTGSHVHVYDNKDSNNEVMVVEPDKTLAQEHYFIAYLPNDSKTGILAVQSSNTSNMTSPFREHFSAIVAKLGYKVGYGRFVPDKYIKTYLGNTALQYLTIFKGSKLKEDVRHNDIEGFEKVQVKIKISNFAMSFSRLLEYVNPSAHLKEQVLALGIDYDEAEDDIEVSYGTDVLKPTKAKIDDLEKIMPQYQMHAPEIDSVTHKPHWEVTHGYALEIIKEVIKEKGL